MKYDPAFATSPIYVTDKDYEFSVDPDIITLVESDPFQKPMPFPPKPSMKKDDEDFECFAEMIRPIFLRMRLTDMLKTNPYAKYMKDIITNKRKILEAEISTMLSNYTFEGGIPKKLGDPGVPTILCSIKRNYVKTALRELVLVLCLSLYIKDLI